jgi:hypothetical protein
VTSSSTSYPSPPLLPCCLTTTDGNSIHGCVPPLVRRPYRHRMDELSSWCCGDASAKISLPMHLQFAAVRAHVEWSHVEVSSLGRQRVENNEGNGGATVFHRRTSLGASVPRFYEWWPPVLQRKGGGATVRQWGCYHHFCDTSISRGQLCCKC